MINQYEEKASRGHGCCGFITVFFLVVAIIISLLALSTNVLSSTKQKVMGFFYPQKYSEYVSLSASAYGVDESLVYAVIRTESGFRQEVESSAGAMGLMQLMPDTFEWLQTKRDVDTVLSESYLLDPKTNIDYGTYFLSYLLNKYDGNESTAVAAYNAGMTTVDNWLKDSMYSSDGITLSNIPYEETSNYVIRVEKTQSMYEKLYY